MSWLGRSFGIMLKRLHLKNFTVFADANFEFGPGLNVLVGTNGTGKSHVLKVGYAASQAWHYDAHIVRIYGPTALGVVGAYSMEVRLNHLFGLSNTNKLLRHGQSKATVEATAEEGPRLGLSIAATDYEAGVTEAEVDASSYTYAEPIFIPAKEILTLGWMLPVSKQIEALQLEQNYLDLLEQLRGLELSKPPAPEAVQLLISVLGGKLKEERDTYYLVDEHNQRMQASLMAEGLRKFGMLQKLLLNGSLTPQTTLFWDEPEANLNPALLQKLAAILAELARQGFQIILATHSTDLLKEFHILSRQEDAKKLEIQYFGLNARPGEATTVVTTDNFEYLPDVVALEVELKQADELEEIFIREDREYYANNPGEQPSI